MYPTVHLNGTSRDVLVKGYVEAGRAVAKALDAVAQNGPNARDYYPQGPDAFSVAKALHEARLRKLREVRDELQELVERISSARVGTNGGPDTCACGAPLTARGECRYGCSR